MADMVHRLVPNPQHETKRMLAFLQQLMGKPLADAYVDDGEEAEAPAEPVAARSTPQPHEIPVFTLTPSSSDRATRAEPPPSQQSLELATATEVLEKHRRRRPRNRGRRLGDDVPLGTPEKPMTVRIISGRSDPTQGLISEATPLAQALMAATVGDEVCSGCPVSPRRLSWSPKSCGRRLTLR